MVDRAAVDILLIGIPGLHIFAAFVDPFAIALECA